MIEIAGVQPEDADKWWPIAKGWCADALEYGCGLLSVEDIIAGVDSQHMQMWMIFRDGQPVAVSITEIICFPREKMLSAFIIGGVGMEDWVGALDDTLTRYAQDCGCSMLNGSGRKGWERVLKKFGWGSPSATYMKRV